MIIYLLDSLMGFPGDSDGKEPACQGRRCGFNPWAWKIPWRREWQPNPVFLPRKSHGKRSLVGCSPRGHKELDTIERLTQHSLPERMRGFPSSSAIEDPPANAGDMGSVPGWGKSPGEGNGSPLQDSCLGNPKDREPGGLLFMGLQRVGHNN